MSGHIQWRRRLRKTGAALVVAAGAFLTALSLAAIAGFFDEANDGFDWPVYAVLALMSLALMWVGIQNWRRTQ